MLQTGNPAGAVGPRIVMDGLKSAHEPVGQTSVVACFSEMQALFAVDTNPTYRIEADVGEGLPAVACDENGLKHAILNLVSNARDAMPNGGTIVLRAGSYSDGKGVEICVADSGVGMTEETARRAFEPCFTTKTAGLGGLGLPMAELFARGVGGRILVESLLGSGTVMRLQIPATLSRP